MVIAQEVTPFIEYFDDIKKCVFDLISYIF
jgi:hypothetical protein